MNDYQKALRFAAEEFDSWDEVPMMTQRNLCLKKHAEDGVLESWTAIADEDWDYLAGKAVGGAVIDGFRKAYMQMDDSARLAAAYSILVRMERNFNSYYMVKVEEDFDSIQGEIREPGIQGRIVDEWIDRARYS